MFLILAIIQFYSFILWNDVWKYKQNYVNSNKMKTHKTCIIFATLDSILEFSQTLVSNSWDIPDMDKRCQDKYWTNIFLDSNFLVPKCFGTQNIFESKILFDPKLLGPKNFLNQKIFLDQDLNFWILNFLNPTVFGQKIIWDPNSFWIANFLYPKKLLVQFWTLISFDPKNH